MATVQPSFERHVIDVGDVHLVSLSGELDVATADGLFEWVSDIAGSTIVVDLSEVTFLDSSGLALLARLRNRFGDEVVITRPRPNVTRVFEITGLSSWLTDWDPAWNPPDGPSETA